MKRPKRKKVFMGVIVVIGALVLVEILALIWLYLSVARFEKFWVEKAKQPGEITYLALGDSAAQGIGASSPMKGYVGLITNRLEAETGKSVRVVNLGVTGAKLDDYLHDQAPQVKNYQPDYVTIEIGANDVGKYNEDEFRTKFKKVLDTLPKGTYVANMPLFNSRPGSTESGKRASKVIEQELKENGKMNFVNLEKETSENQSIFGFAPDLFHPNNLSYKNWANAFWQEIQKDPRLK
jgi:lysophospholipase L1-like esterase